MNRRSLSSTVILSASLGALGLIGCDQVKSVDNRPRLIAPDAAFAKMIQGTHRLNSADAQVWVTDVLSSLDTVGMVRTNESACAVMAVIEQESGYKEDPAVPGLSNLLANKIKKMEENLAVKLALEVRLNQPMNSGKTFREGISLVKTERDLASWYSEFTASKYLGPLLDRFGKGVDDVVGTVGSMQVSIDYARRVAAQLGQSSMNMRETLYTRKGGVLFGTAHLFYYPTHYEQMIYRFADYNAGHYASRNAGFQAMVAKLSGKPLSADGDLIAHDAVQPNTTSQTQTALQQLFAKKAPNISTLTIAQDLALEKTLEFEQSTTYLTVTQLYRQKYGALITEQIPRISLKSEKITRHLTTEWYANSVNRRYQQCLAAAQRAT